MKKGIQFKAAALLMLLVTVMSVCGLSALADTINNTVGGFGFPYNAGGQAFLLKAKTLDLSVLTVASNDTVQVINIPAGSRVLGVQYRLTTATATNKVTTFDIGDGANAAGWASNVSSTNEAGWQASGFAASAATNGVITVTGYSAGKFYAADDTIDVHFDGDPGSSGKIDVTAVVIRAVE